MLRGSGLVCRGPESNMDTSRSQTIGGHIHADPLGNGIACHRSSIWCLPGWELYELSDNHSSDLQGDTAEHHTSDKSKARRCQLSWCIRDQRIDRCMLRDHYMRLPRSEDRSMRPVRSTPRRDTAVHKVKRTEKRRGRHTERRRESCTGRYRNRNLGKILRNRGLGIAGPG